MAIIMQDRFEEKLRKAGLVGEIQLEQAVLLQKREGGELSDILVGLGFLSDTQMQKCMAEVEGTNFSSLEELLALPFSAKESEILPYAQALQEMILPIQRQGYLELITLRLPTEEERQAYQKRFAPQRLVFGLATHRALLQSIRYHYGRFLLESLEKSETPKPSTSSEPDPGEAERRQTQQIRLRQERLCPSCAFPYEPSAEVCPKCSKPLKGSAAVVDPLLGLVIEKRWQLTKQLGEGGMGMVYRANDLELKDECAIKLLHLSDGIDPKVVQRFEKEAKILQDLHHPNILSVRSFGQHPSFGFYLVMEFLRGCNLHEYTKEKAGDFELEEVADILAPVCLAMDHAHDHGVIHRDIKPENIFLQQHEGKLQSVKVIDFGIARRDNRGTRLTSTGMMIGTPRYISPEQILGKETDSRSDIYSLTVILFELLTRRDLYDADNVYEYLMRHIYAPPPPISQCRPDRRFPPSLERLVLFGLSKAPGERPATMRLFRQMLLEGCYGGTGPSTPLPSHAHTPPLLADEAARQDGSSWKGSDIWEEAKPILAEISEPYHKTPPPHHGPDGGLRPVLGRRADPAPRSGAGVGPLPSGANPALSSAIAALPPRQATAASLPALPPRQATAASLPALPPSALLRKPSGPQAKTSPRSALLEAPKKRRWLHVLLVLFLFLPFGGLAALAIAPDSTHRAIYTILVGLQNVAQTPLTTDSETQKGKEAWRRFGRMEGYPRFRQAQFLPPPEPRSVGKRPKKRPSKGKRPPRRVQPKERTEEEEKEESKDKKEDKKEEEPKEE